MNMCRKCVGSRVCECGGDNGNGVTNWSAGSKKQQKQKQPKILKRGPGVAELEKILREQETTSDLPATQRGDNGGFSFSLSWPCPNSSTLNSHVPSFSPAIGSMYGNSATWEPKSNLNEVVDGSQSDDSAKMQINQFHGNFMPQDEQKIVVGTTQTDTSSLAKSLTPQFNESDGVSSYNHTNECYSTFELNNQRFNSENDGSGDANFLQYVVSEIPPPPMPSSPSVHSVVHDGKPFFNFLEVKAQEGVADATSGSSNDGIDLTLKL
ncbi:hypothetical protein RYX36_001136 [Vicia faba]